jgi:hypothetical protein
LLLNTALAPSDKSRNINEQKWKRFHWQINCAPSYLLGAEELPDLWRWTFCHLPSFRCHTLVSSACVVTGKPVLQVKKTKQSEQAIATFHSERCLTWTYFRTSFCVWYIQVLRLYRLYMNKDFLHWGFIYFI